MMSLITILRCKKRSIVQEFLILTGVLLILRIVLNVRTTDELLRQSCSRYYGDRSHDELTRHPNEVAPSYEELSTVGDRFKNRRQHLKEKCKNSSLHSLTSDIGIKQHLIIDDKYKLVYCSIEKNGCTFWKRVFQILNGFKNVTSPFQTRGIYAYGGYKTAKKMPFYEINNVLTYSTKFIFVRDPFERLLSGYVDKIFLPSASYWFELGRYIVQTFRRNNGSSATRCGDDVTFEEFVRYFIHSQKTNKKRDAHFFHNYEHCRPCEIDYDYIAKLENFKEDTLFLLQKLKLNNTVHIKNFEKETERDAIVDAVDWGSYMIKNVDKCSTKDKVLLKIYRKLQIRGIISKDVPFPISSTSAKTIGKEEYKNALLSVHAQSGPREKRKMNRKEAFSEAYSSLSPDLLTELQKELSVDAELFGYETFPEMLKVSESYVPTFRYFGTSTGHNQDI